MYVSTFRAIRAYVGIRFLLSSQAFVVRQPGLFPEARRLEYWHRLSLLVSRALILASFQVCVLHGYESPSEDTTVQ